MTTLASSTPGVLSSVKSGVFSRLAARASAHTATHSLQRHAPRAHTTPASTLAPSHGSRSFALERSLGQKEVTSASNSFQAFAPSSLEGRLRSETPVADGCKRFHGTHVDRTKEPTLTVHFVEKDGSVRTVTAWNGENVLEVAHENDIPVEGACEGSLACSTCHLVVTDEKMYDSFKEPTVREEDLLDLAPGLTETSRLCCQLKLDAKKHDGIRFIIPSVTRNFYCDGHVPKPH